MASAKNLGTNKWELIITGGIGYKNKRSFCLIFHSYVLCSGSARSQWGEGSCGIRAAAEAQGSDPGHDPQHRGGAAAAGEQRQDHCRLALEETATLLPAEW